MISSAAVAVVYVTLYSVHQVMDHWGQTSAWAACKGRAGHEGRVACLKHVLTYTGVGVVAVAIVAALSDLTVSPFWLAAGALVTASTHYFADRRTPLARLANRTGHAGFYRLGAPRPNRDDNPSLGTGAYALDQAWHVGWLLPAAIITAI